MSKKNQEAATVATVIKWTSYVAMFGSVAILLGSALSNDKPDDSWVNVLFIAFACGIVTYLIGVVLELLVNIANDIERSTRWTDTSKNNQ